MSDSSEVADRLQSSGAAADELDGTQAADSATVSCSGDDWIAIELVDAIGRPVADEPFCLTLPDGRKRVGKTDAGGKARIEKIASGDCTLSFTALDQDAWSPG